MKEKMIALMETADDIRKIILTAQISTLETLIDCPENIYADVEEVVRCKDCKNCDKVDDYELWCCGHGMPYRLTTADDFCSHGKRRETE